MHKYIISGGPGAGKTTLLQALHQKGHRVSEEVSRQLIQEEVAKESACLPWLNLPCFAQKVLARMVQQHAFASNFPETTFFDRGIPDIIAYLQAAALPVAEAFFQALAQHPYHHTVFIAPPWPAIYKNDLERWQTFDEAADLHHIIKETYLHLGFRVVDLPLASVEERVRFVTAYLALQ